MAKKLSSVLGVDIGSRTTKIAEFRMQGKQPVLTALGMIDTPEGAVDHTGVYNAEAVGQAIKEATKKMGASVGQAVVTIAGQSSVLVRTLEVPKMNATELKEHMQWEINRNIPFSESTVVSDYKPLEDGDPNAQNMDVVMAIAPQSAIDTLLATFKKAGKQLAAIDVEPMSLARAYQFNYEDTYGDEIICLVDIGYKTTSINIYRGGRLLMPRQVPLGGELFTKAIADTQGVGLEDAEATKFDLVDLTKAQLSGGGFGGGFDVGGGQDFAPYNPFAADTGQPQEFSPYNPFAAAEPEPVANPFAAPVEPAEDGAPEEGAVEGGEFGGDVAAFEPEAPAPFVEQPLVAATVDPATTAANDAVVPTVEEFVSEIRRSMDYFSGRGGVVTRVFLAGGASRLRGLADYLQRSLGVPCDDFEPTRRLNIGGKKVDSAFVEEHGQEFVVAIGNGLYIFF